MKINKNDFLKLIKVDRWIYHMGGEKNWGALFDYLEEIEDVEYSPQGFINDFCFYETKEELLKAYQVETLEELLEPSIIIEVADIIKVPDGGYIIGTNKELINKKENN